MRPSTFLRVRAWQYVCLLVFSLTAVVEVGSLSASTPETQSVVVVVGAQGEAEFGRQFNEWADRWQSAAESANARFIRIGGSASDKPDRERLREALLAEATGSETFWLILIGHGTFDGRSAKFNLEGPDISAGELAEWLATNTRPTVVINCASSSGPFLTALSAPNRVVVTATRSGHEHNFARFGDYLSKAITEMSSDLDKDGQVSVLEAYLAASHGVTEFYEQQARLATEHAILDDNGDKQGTPPDWFQGTRATKTSKDGAAVDGIRANQLCLVRSEQEQQLTVGERRQRDELEVRLAVLRSQKTRMDDAEYFQRLEELLVKLAEIYEGKSGTQVTEEPSSTR